MEGAWVGTAQVDDRNAREVVGLVDRAAAVVVADRRLGPVGPRARVAEVDVRAADLVVQVDELRGADRPVLQRLEAELDADVADGKPREAVADLLLVRRPHAARPRREHVDHVVRERAAHAAGVRVGVVHLRVGHTRASAGRVGERLPVDGVEDDRVAVVRVALDRRDLLGRPDDPRAPLLGVLEVAAREVIGG